jgi:hypothetical protein
VSSGCGELSRQGATPREWGRISCSVYESFRKIPRCATFLSSGPPSSPTFRRRLAREPNLPSPTSGGSVRTSRANGAAVDGPPRRFSEPFLRAIEASPAIAPPARVPLAAVQRAKSAIVARLPRAWRKVVAQRYPRSTLRRGAPSVAKSARPHDQYAPLSSRAGLPGSSSGHVSRPTPLTRSRPAATPPPDPRAMAMTPAPPRPSPGLEIADPRRAGTGAPDRTSGGLRS